jgi:hypothetical protein
MTALSEVFRIFQPHSKYFAHLLEACSARRPENPPANVQREEEKIMSSKLSMRISAVAAAALASVLILGVGRSAGARQEPSSSREIGSSRGGALVGTWRAQVQPYNCQTNAPFGPPFASLLTFNDGGTLVGSTSSPAFAVGQRGTDFGVWSHQGRQTFNAKSEVFLYFTTPPNLPLNPGFQAGTQTLTQTIEFKDNPDEVTSDATTEFFDTTGKLYREGCASAVAKRLE